MQWHDALIASNSRSSEYRYCCELPSPKGWVPAAQNELPGIGLGVVRVQPNGELIC